MYLTEGYDQSITFSGLSYVGSLSLTYLTDIYHMIVSNQVIEEQKEKDRLRRQRQPAIRAPLPARELPLIPDSSTGVDDKDDGRGVVIVPDSIDDIPDIGDNSDDQRGVVRIL